MDSLRDGKSELDNTNKLVRFYKGTTGLKTGTTSIAKYCLSASAQRDGLSLVAVVLAGETSNDRFEGAKKLLDYGFANYALVTPDSAAGTVPVKLGKVQEISAIPGETPQFLIEKAQRGSVTTELILEPTVTAPVSAGQKLGTLTVRVGEQVLAQIPMVAQNAVDRLTLGDLIVLVLKQTAMAK